MKDKLENKDFKEKVVEIKVTETDLKEMAWVNQWLRRRRRSMR